MIVFLLQQETPIELALIKKCGILTTRTPDPSTPMLAIKSDALTGNYIFLTRPLTEESILYALAQASGNNVHAFAKNIDQESLLQATSSLQRKINDAMRGIFLHKNHKDVEEIIHEQKQWIKRALLLLVKKKLERTKK